MAYRKRWVGGIEHSGDSDELRQTGNLDWGIIRASCRVQSHDASNHQHGHLFDVGCN